MKKILFFETNEFTGATRVTRTLAKTAKKEYEVAFAKVGLNVREDIEFAIKKENPDILFASFIQINPEVILEAKRQSIYVIVRNDYKLEDVSENVRLRAIETYPLADMIITQTDEMRKNLLTTFAIDPVKVKVLENPLDEEDILEKAKEQKPFREDGCFHFLWVGREDPIKDLPTLYRAFEVVHTTNPDSELTLISNEENPYKWIKNADCLVISSKSEASPNVLREALFLGTPVISTDCSPTVRQLLSANRIVPVGDSNRLAEAMNDIIRERRNSSNILV